MHIYSAGHWVLLFFFYCLCGWVWECCYVSARQRRWINRGFLRGPVLPIYGSGAIIILFATLPVAENLWLVYLFGTLSATALEYVTGAVMERLFQVRYWDYSNQKCNLNGYICLSSSVAWGFFSILLVRFLHPPVERLLAHLPALLVDPLALALVAGFTVDAVISVQAALNLREILTKLAEENEDLRRLAKRAEVISAFAEEDLRSFRDKTALEKWLLQARLEDGVAELVEEHREAKKQRRAARQALLERTMRRSLDGKLQVLRSITEALETASRRLEDVPMLEGASLEQRQQDIAELIARVEARERVIRARSVGSYRRALRILQSNPTARVRAELSEALDTLRQLRDRS